MSDDIILSSVSSERYLHLSNRSETKTIEEVVEKTDDAGQIDLLGEKEVVTREVEIENYLAHASFQRSLWMIGPIQSEVKQGYLCGGDVLRLFHGRMSDDCLCNPDVTDVNIDPMRKTIFYEGGLVATHARSLWRIELTKIKWSGSHIRIGQSFRLRHMCTGKFLILTRDRHLDLGDANDAEWTAEGSVFCFRSSKDKVDAFGDYEPESMGDPEIKYSESLVVLQHISSGLWVTYQAQGKF